MDLPRSYRRPAGTGVSWQETLFARDGAWLRELRGHAGCLSRGMTYALLEERQRMAPGRTGRVDDGATQTVGKRTLAEQVPYQYTQMDAGLLAQIAEGAAEPGLEPQPQSEPQQAAKSQDDLGVATTQVKLSVNLLETKHAWNGRPLDVKIDLELIALVEAGATTPDGTRKAPTTRVMGNELKIETKRKGIIANLKSSLKTSVVGTKLMLNSRPIDLKFFEASVADEQLSKVRRSSDLLDLDTKLDLVKASTYLTSKDLPLLGQFAEIGYEGRLKVEFALPLSAIIPDADMAELRRITTKIDDATRRLAEWEKVTGKILDESEDFAQKLKSSGVRKGRFHKNPELADAKRKLRALASELDEVAEDPMIRSKVLRWAARRMVRNQSGKIIARIAAKTLTKLTRLIPIVGWVLFAYDVLELGYLGWNIATGRATFLGGGGEVSLAGDIWDSFGDGPTEPLTTDGKTDGDGKGDGTDEPTTELAKLSKEDQAKLRDSGSPVGRLIKGIAMEMDESKLTAEHLQRLLQIAADRQLTHEQVGAILAQVAKNAPRSSPEAVLAMLEKLLDNVRSLPTIDTNGDGIADAADTNGDGTPDAFDRNGDGQLDRPGNGSGNGDGKGKTNGKGNGNTNGKGKGNTDGKGDTKTKRDGRTGDTNPDAANLPALDTIIDDPLAAGLIQLQMTSGGMSDPKPTNFSVATRGGVVRCTAVRFRGGVGPRVVGSDGDMYMEIFVDLAIETGRTGGLTLKQLKTRTYEYGWFAASNSFTRMRTKPGLPPAIATALARKMSSGASDSVGFKILEQQRAQGGWNVKVQITWVRPDSLVLRTVDGKRKEYEVGQVETYGITDAEIAGAK